MDATLIIVSAAAVVAVASIGITLVAFNRFRGRGASEDTDATNLGKAWTAGTVYTLLADVALTTTPSWWLKEGARTG
jgi:hypothetical protein